MYDSYCNILRTDLRLIVPRGAKLPDAISSEKWRPTHRLLSIPQIVSDEIERSGFSIIRQKKQEESP